MITGWTIMPTEFLVGFNFHLILLNFTLKDYNSTTTQPNLMKMKLTLCIFYGFIVSFTIVLSSCKSSSSKDESTSTDTTVVGGGTRLPVTICMLPEVGIRESAGESGKYLTTLYLSEQVTLTGDSATAKVGEKEYAYFKVKLEDGKQGWVRADFIARNVVPAVFTAVTSINKRPDLASITDKNFSTMDFVATKPAKDDWVEVTGIPSGEKWFTKGYVHANNLTYDAVDVSFAALYKRASSMKDGSALMTQLSNDKNLQSSRFYAGVFGVSEQQAEQEGNDMNDIFAEYLMNNNTFIENTKNTNLDNHGVTSTADRYGNSVGAASFNGSSYLSSPLFEDLQDATYMLWVKSDKDQSSSILTLGNNCTSGYSIGLDKSVLAILCGGVQVNITNSTYSLPVGEWVHIALVKSGNDFSVYVNGELSSSGSSSHNSLTSLFTIGAGSGCNGIPIGGYFSGSIDDIYIFNRAYEAGEVREQYQQGKLP